MVGDLERRIERAPARGGPSSHNRPVQSPLRRGIRSPMAAFAACSSRSECLLVARIWRRCQAASERCCRVRREVIPGPTCRRASAARGRQRGPAEWRLTLTGAASTAPPRQPTGVAKLRSALQPPRPGSPRGARRPPWHDLHSASGATPEPAERPGRRACLTLLRDPSHGL